MNELENLYATLGRKQMELDRLRSEYRNLLGTIEQIKAGNVNPQHIQIDTGPALSWRIQEPPAPLTMTKPEGTSNGQDT